MASIEPSHSGTLAIILGSILGFLVLVFVVLLVVLLKRRSRRRGSIFRRAVTPLPDAEFESWRRPNEHRKWLEKHKANPTSPPPSLPSPYRARREPPNGIAISNSSFTEPDYGSKTPSRNTDRPEHERSKSGSSLQDRPPTPYSLTMPPEDSGEWPSPKTPTRRDVKHFHYPSLSEASDFEFGFRDYEKHQSLLSSPGRRPSRGT